MYKTVLEMQRTEFATFGATQGVILTLMECYNVGKTSADIQTHVHSHILTDDPVFMV